MTLEFIVGYHSFETCYEAMQFLSDKKLKLIQNKKNYECVSQSEWLQVVDGFLALGEQCERQPTKHFEHYPRLAKEWALELLNDYVYDIYDKKLRNECNQNYINCFDLMEYLHQYY